MADLNDEKKDMQPLFDCIVNNIPAPEGDPDADTQMLISTIDYNEFVGRIGVGKIDNGSLKVNQEVMIVNHHDPSVKKRVRITKLYTFNGLNKVEVNEAGIGEIVAVSGIADIHIGDTICSLNNPVAIPFQKISEPTLSMDFMVNDSPLAGQEGKFVTSRHLRDRLFKELNTDVSLRVEETPGVENSFKVSGRGELHLSVLIENMRREGYEFAVSKADVLYHTDERGHQLTVDTQDFSSLFLQEVLSDTEVNSLLILRVTVLSILLLKDMKNTKETFLTERMVLLLLTKAVMLSLMVFSMRRKEVLSSSDLVRRYMPE